MVGSSFHPENSVVVLVLSANDRILGLTGAGPEIPVALVADSNLPWLFLVGNLSLILPSGSEVLSVLVVVVVLLVCCSVEEDILSKKSAGNNPRPRRDEVSSASVLVNISVSGRVGLSVGLNPGGNGGSSNVTSFGLKPGGKGGASNLTSPKRSSGLFEEVSVVEVVEGLEPLLKGLGGLGLLGLNLGGRLGKSSICSRLDTISANKLVSVVVLVVSPL